MTSQLLRWLKKCWPAHDWTRATLTHACFHDVAILAPHVVARVSRHGDQSARVHREHGILEVLTAVPLPFTVPRTRSAVVIRAGRAGMLTTYLSGEPRPDIPWRAAAAPLGKVLVALSRVDRAEVLGRLPMPRAWCGGERWPALVRERLVPRLPEDVRSPALRVVDGVLCVERSAPPALVHRDFGPHNLLWEGDTVVGVIDFDHACVGDPAIDAASLISFFGAAAVGSIVDASTLKRAMLHRASLTLQLAAAAELVGDDSLFAHALANFAARVRAGTLYDPGGRFASA